MVKLTMIARVTDGLPLVEGLDDGRDMPDVDYYKKQAKALFTNLSRGQNEASRMSIETGPYVFQYPLAYAARHYFIFVCSCSFMPLGIFRISQSSLISFLYGSYTIKL